MSKGYVITLDDLLKTKEVVVQLFNGQRWKIKENKAFRFSVFYEEGKPYEVIFAEGTTDELFSQIKLIFDLKGRILARRIQMSHPLKTVRINNFFRVKKPDPKKAALNIYQAIEEQEAQDFGRQMSAYWYSSKKCETLEK